MLRVTRLGGGRSAYYLSDMAAEIDAVLLADQRHEAGGVTGRAIGAEASIGRWIGSGTAGFGWSGPVDPDRFARLLEERGPHGRPLPVSATSVRGYDLTFTCPKSVSVLFALGGPSVPTQVLDAHESAVRAAMDYVDRMAVTVRRGTGEERTVVGSGGAVGAAFTHGASRGLDPHLHTHVVVANLAHGTDGRWSAIDGRGLFAHATAAGALYGAHLRHELSSRLAVEWEQSPTGRREIAGMDPVVLAEFSGRRAEIRTQLWQWGWGASTRSSSHVAWAVTRGAKGSESERAALVPRWHERAEALGTGPADLAQVVGRALPAVEGIDEHRFAADLWVSPHAAPVRREVVRAWADALSRGAPGAEIEGAVQAWAPDRGERGVAESPHPLREIVPGGYLVRGLGARPVAADHQAAWQDGARAIEGYRRRWNVSSPEHPLGVEAGSSSLAQLPARRLADHLAVTRTLDAVARRLGRDDRVRMREQGLERGIGR